MRQSKSYPLTRVHVHSVSVGHPLKTDISTDSRADCIFKRKLRDLYDLICWPVYHCQVHGRVVKGGYSLQGNGIVFADSEIARGTSCEIQRGA